jgi:hypothetical protein
MMSKVKSEVDIFGMSVEDVDFLDQVVHNLQKIFDSGLFLVSVSALTFLFTHYFPFGTPVMKCSAVYFTAYLFLLQRLLQVDSPLRSSIDLIRSNKKLLDAFHSCFTESSSEIILRIGEQHVLEPNLVIYFNRFTLLCNCFVCHFFPSTLKFGFQDLQRNSHMIERLYSIL